MPTKQKQRDKNKQVKKVQPGQKEPAGLGGGATIEREHEEATGQRQQAERENPRDKRVEAEQNRGQTHGH